MTVKCCATCKHYDAEAGTCDAFKPLTVWTKATNDCKEWRCESDE